MKATKVSILLAGILACGAATAQSSIECRPGPDGKFQAALIWQNTLGVERANTICQQHVIRLGLDKPAEVEKQPVQTAHASHPSPQVEAAHLLPSAAPLHNTASSSSRFSRDTLDRAYATVASSDASNQSQTVTVAATERVTQSSAPSASTAQQAHSDAVMNGYVDLQSLATTQEAKVEAPLEGYDALF